MTGAKQLIIFLSFFCVFVVGQNEYFSIVGPRFIRQGEDYEAVLSSTSSSEPSEVNSIEVTLWTQKNKKQVHKQVFELSGISQRIKFDIKSQALQNYTLIAKIPKTNVLSSANIYVIETKCSVLIQTDKVLYKAGDTVRFRVIAIDENTKPCEFQKIRIIITDAKKNSVLMLNKPEFINGVYEGSMLLSDAPLYGKWGIHAMLDNKRRTVKNFNVADYQLPRFEAVIDTTPLITLNDGNVKLTLFARYTFGKNHGLVIGEARVSVEVFKGTLSSPAIKKIEKKVKVNTKETLTLKFVRDLGIKSESVGQQFLRCLLVFEEALTNRTMTTSRIITVNGRNEQMFELVREKNFKSGLPFSLKYIVRDRHGQFLMGKDEKVQLSVQYYNKPSNSCQSFENKESSVQGETLKYEAPLIDGVAEFSVKTEKKNNALSLKVKYKDSVQSSNVQRAPSKSREYIKVAIKTESPQINNKVSVSVTGTDDLGTVYAVIIGRTGVIYSETFQTEGNLIPEFNFVATAEMIPQATLFVYYHQPTGEIVFDKVVLILDSRLPNDLKISLATDTVEPFDDVTISLDSTANSIVYLTAIDLAVTLLSVGNNINKNEVYESFLKNSQITVNDDKPTVSPQLDFVNSNAIILTNAVKGIFDCSKSRLNDVDELNKEREIFFSTEDNTSENYDVNFMEPRKEFKETWIFESFKVDENGQFKLTKKVPDSITSWMIDGFAMNPLTGLGVAETQKLSVSKEFFVQVELPYSVRLGEVVNVEVFVFNYHKTLKREIITAVSLEGSEDEFEIMQRRRNCAFVPLNQTTSTQSVSVKHEQAALTVFLIRPKVTGQIKIKVKGNAGLFGDSVERLLYIKHDGVSHYKSKTLLVDVRHKKFYSHYFTFDIDKASAIAGTTRVGASAIGNVMGFETDRKKFRPIGLSKFAATLFSLEYLKEIDKLTTEILDESNDILTAGYQDLIKMKTSKGSFGSIWLTALALKYLGHVKHWIEIDDNHIVDAFTYLRNKQTKSGAFKEEGELDDNYALTASTVIAFMENTVYKERFKGPIKKAIDYLNIQSATVDSNYELAIAAYAMALNENSNTETMLAQLSESEIVEGNETHWNLPMNQKRSESVTAQPMKIEIASHVLLALLKTENNDKALPVLNWLVNNARASGGFALTRDAAISLQALTEAAKAFYSKSFKVEIDLLDDEEKATRITVNQSNALNEQRVELPETNAVSVMAQGSGIASLNIWSRYNTHSSETSKRFSLSVVVVNKAHKNMLELTICTKFSPDSEKSKSDLAVLEIAMPSGYEFDPASKSSLEKADVKRFETQEGGTIAIVYLENITSAQTCITVTALKKSGVEALQNVPIKIYDFYQSEHFGVIYYKPKDSLGTCAY